jgi:hypothetical protein
MEMSKKQQQFTIFTPKLHLECVHLIKQLMTFHFGGHWFINPLEVMFTSAVGFGEHHFPGVDKSQCPPYEKSLIVYCYPEKFIVNLRLGCQWISRGNNLLYHPLSYASVDNEFLGVTICSTTLSAMCYL